VLGRRKMDWHKVFQGYVATVDMPCAAYYKQLMEAFPDAVVLLTVRDPEGWWRSFSALNTMIGSLAALGWVFRVPPATKFVPLWKMVIFRFFGVKRLGHPHDKGLHIARFNAHIQEVTAAVPPGKLLVFNVKQVRGQRVVAGGRGPAPWPHSLVTVHAA
jgi:hypothetical protein